MPIIQITTGENNSYDRRYQYDSAYNASQITVGGRYTESGPNYGDTIHRGFVRFDLTSLKHKIIKQAILKLYPNYVGAGSNIYFGHVTSDILISQINSSSGISWQNYSMKQIYTSDAGDYFNLHVTGLIRDMVDGLTTTDIIILYGRDYESLMGEVYFHGFSGQNPPILEVEYENIPPSKPTELNTNYTPSTGDVEFSWQFNESEQGGDESAGYDLQYSYDNQNWTTVSRETEEAKHTFPLGTFQSGVIYWRVRTKNDWGGISEWSDIKEFLFSGYQTGIPLIISPAGNIITDTDVLFVWQYNPSGNWDEQTRYELQYSLDGSTWKTIFANSSDTSVVIPKYEFQSGTVWWRVRVRNNYNYMSQWSTTTTFTYAGKPRAPIIISGNSFSIANITVEWVSTEQVSYQVRILEDSNVIVDTGEVVTATQKKYSRILENNKTYIIQVRIKNQFGLWSDYTTQTITVNFELPAKPLMVLLANEKRGSVEIKIINGTGGATFLENEVYRKGKEDLEWTMIAKGIGKNGTFADCTVISEEEYEYRVRTIGSTLGYNDSDSDIIKVKVRNTQLANTENYEEWVELIYNQNKTSRFKFEEHLMKFAGRKKAVVERGEFEDVDISMTFTVLGYKNLEKLINLIKKRETLLLRDSRKKKMYVTIDNLQIKEDWKNWEYEVSFSVIEVDFSEVV